MANILLLIFTLWLAIKGSVSVDTLESTPPSVNGVLTACAGQQISLTCRNTNTDNAITFWTASSPINCERAVVHLPNSPASPCGPFMFEEITRVELGGGGSPLPPLNSTAVATAAANMTNSTVECRGGTTSAPVSVGNISLCILASLPPPTNLMCTTTPRGLNITYELGIDTSCDVNYLVTAMRTSDMMTIVSPMEVTETSVELTNTLGLQPNTSYTISVSALTVGGSCESQPATLTCDTSPDLPIITTPSTTLSTTLPSTSPTTRLTSRGLSAGAIAAIVVVFIVLIIIAVVIVIVVVIVIRISPQGKGRDQDGVHDSLGGEQQVNAYAMIDKNTTK